MQEKNRTLLSEIEDCKGLPCFGYPAPAHTGVTCMRQSAETPLVMATCRVIIPMLTVWYAENPAMTAHGCSVNYSQALPEVTVSDNSAPLISAGWGTALVWVCTDVEGRGGVDQTHTKQNSWRDSAHVHRAHVCTCQLEHADKYGHGEDKSIFTWWKLALSSAFSQKRWLRKKKRERQRTDIFKIHFTLISTLYIVHCLPLKYFTTCGHWKPPL